MNDSAERSLKEESDEVGEATTTTTTTTTTMTTTTTKTTASVAYKYRSTTSTKKQFLTAAAAAAAAAATAATVSTCIITSGGGNTNRSCSNVNIPGSATTSSGGGGGSGSSLFVQGVTVGAGSSKGSGRGSGNGNDISNNVLARTQSSSHNRGYRRSPFAMLRDINDDDIDVDIDIDVDTAPENIGGCNRGKIGGEREHQQQETSIEDSILCGIRCRGGGSHENKNRDTHRKNKKNKERKNDNGGGGGDDNKDDEVNENMERTKLSFSTLSQATEKKSHSRKTKKKKKKFSSSSHDSATNSFNRHGASASTSASASSSSSSQQPPPPPPPPPLSKEKMSKSKNAKTGSGSGSTSTSRQQPPPPPPPPPSSSSSSTTTTNNHSAKEEMIQQILKTTDYYQMLNLVKPSNKNSKKSLSSHTATITKTQITKAYRKQAVITHPDKNNGDREAFDKVREAYDVLKDDIKRKVYDKYGTEGIKNPDLFAAASAAAASSSPSSFGAAAAAAGGASSIQEQILKSFFGSSTSSMSGGMFGNSYYSSGGGGGRYNQQKQHQQATNQDAKYELQVSLEDLYNGKQYDLEILLPSASSSSSRTKKTVEVEIPRGMLNQQSIRYSGYVDTIKTSTPADLIFIVKQKHHPIYTRKGFDLVMEVRLSFKEAICGFEREIVHLDGRKMKIRNPYFEGSGGSSGSRTESFIGNSSINEQKKNGPVMISTGDVHVLKGEGMPKFNWAEKKSTHDDDSDHFDQDEINKQYGDLYVQYIVEMPNSAATKNGKKFAKNGDDCNDRLTPEERETLGNLLEKLYGTNRQSKSSSFSYEEDAEDDMQETQTTRRLQVSSASEFGKASGAAGHFDEDDHHMVDDQNDDDMFGFERDGFQYFTRGNSGRRHSGTTSFFSKGFGSGFAGGNFHGDDDDGNVQCQQM